MGFDRIARWPATLLVILVTHAAIGQDTAEPPRIEERLSDPVYMSWIVHDQVTACISCHFSGPNPVQIDTGRADQLTAFSRRIELERWLFNDKHTIARRRVEPFAEDQNEQELMALLDRLGQQQDRAVQGYKNQGITIDQAQIGFEGVPEEWIGDSNILSRRICDKLGYHVETPEGYTHFRDNCLTCHGGYQQGDTGFDFATKGDAQLGIDCLYCHQIGDDKTWVSAHSVPNADENWRLLPPAQKATAGMRDLVGTSNQANLCFDCHVGNRAKKMFVTHEMYAAGHPPIPSIELQTFCKEMPQHWQTPSQLYESLSGYDKRDQYFKTNYPGVVDRASPGETFWNTRKMLIGALTARKKALDLVIDSANMHQWADYSLYDCAACHHELQSQSERQFRGFPGAPGRPRQHEWPDALLTIAYRFYGGPGTEGNKIWETMLDFEDRLAAEFSEQPFGDADRVRPAAEALREHVGAAIEKVERQPLDARIANGVLRGLSRTPRSKLLTYDSARQVVWAMQTIAAELADEGSPLSPQVAALIQSLGEVETAGIEARIPSGRKQFIYSEELDADLRRRANFRPTRLKTALNQINQLLVAAPPDAPNRALVSTPQP